MRKWVLSFLLIYSMLSPMGVHAQDKIALSTLQIQIWPEYDKPAVLVIYNLTLSDTTSLPTSVSIPIPIVAGEPQCRCCPPGGWLAVFDGLQPHTGWRMGND
jgi:hypothetical protein